MSKPIFIVRLPSVYSQSELESIGANLQIRFTDYHVLSCSSPIEVIQFECYNTTDLDTKSFEELKELVKTYKTE